MWASRPPLSFILANYFFLLVFPLAWAKLDATGALSALGVFGFCRSFPACEATFFDVGINVDVPFQTACRRSTHETASPWGSQSKNTY